MLQKYIIFIIENSNVTISFLVNKLKLGRQYIACIHNL